MAGVRHREVAIGAQLGANPLDRVRVGGRGFRPVEEGAQTVVLEREQAVEQRIPIGEVRVHAGGRDPGGAGDAADRQAVLVVELGQQPTGGLQDLRAKPVAFPPSVAHAHRATPHTVGHASILLWVEPATFAATVLRVAERMYAKSANDR